MQSAVPCLSACEHSGSSCGGLGPCVGVAIISCYLPLFPLTSCPPLCTGASRGDTVSCLGGGRGLGHSCTLYRMTAMLLLQFYTFWILLSGLLDMNWHLPPCSFSPISSAKFQFMLPVSSLLSCFLFLQVYRFSPPLWT